MGFFTTYSWRETFYLVSITDSSCIKNWTSLLLLVMPVFYYSNKLFFQFYKYCSVLDCSTRGCHSPAEERPLPQSDDLCTSIYCTQNMFFTITYKTYTQKVWGVFHSFPFIHRQQLFKSFLNCCFQRVCCISIISLSDSCSNACFFSFFFFWNLVFHQYISTASSHTPTTVLIIKKSYNPFGTH